MSRPGFPSTTTNKDEKDLQRLLDRLGNWMAYKNKNKWLEDMRGSLSMTASIIATMTFQAALNPPGGVLEGSATDVINYRSNCNSTHPCPGEAVSAIVQANAYVRFMICNTICFIASVSVCLYLVSGFPLDHRFPTWMLLVTMCMTLVSLALTYLFGLIMITPYSVLGSSDIPTFGAIGAVILAFIALYGAVSLLQALRLIIWCAKGANKRDKKAALRQQTPEENMETSTPVV